MSVPDRRARLDMRNENLSVRRQCALLGLARSGVYRAPAQAGEDAAAMRQIDALYIDHPFYGSRRIAFALKMNRKRVQRLTGALERAGVRISMDGGGRFLDNIFIERLWRSLKHEDIYLKHYADGREVRAGIASWMPSTITGAPIRRSTTRPR
jgi:hypothetical protein